MFSDGNFSYSIEPVHNSSEQVSTQLKYSSLSSFSSACCSLEKQIDTQSCSVRDRRDSEALNFSHMLRNVHYCRWLTGEWADACMWDGGEEQKEGVEWENMRQSSLCMILAALHYHIEICHFKMNEEIRFNNKNAYLRQFFCQIIDSYTF